MDTPMTAENVYKQFYLDMLRLRQQRTEGDISGHYYRTAADTLLDRVAADIVLTECRQKATPHAAAITAPASATP